MMLAGHYTDVPAEEVAGVPGVTVRWLMGKKEGAPNFSFRVFEMKPGASIQPHSHEWEHEVFVLAGQGVVKIEGEARPLKEGDFVFVPPDVEHQFLNEGKEVFRFICVVPLKGDTRD